MNCDLCKSSRHLPILQIPGSVVCMDCGFVYVPRRRNSEEIAHAWDELWSEAYTSQWPGVIARLTYVAEFCDQTFSWQDKHVLDIGAGEGTFLEMIKGKGAKPEGLEPCFENCQKIMDKKCVAHQGTAESFDSRHDYDVVTLLWTLENTGDCMAVLKKAHEFLRPGGLIVVATGSRILVPYKKPFSSYVSDLPPDLHCFRWSANSIRLALLATGFHGLVMNDYEQNDELVCVGHRLNSVPDVSKIDFAAALEKSDLKDDPQAVLRYFRSWKEQFP